MLGRALFQGSDKFDAFGVLFAAGILLQTFGISSLNFGTRRILQGIHCLGVARCDLWCDKLVGYKEGAIVEHSIFVPNSAHNVDFGKCFFCLTRNIPKLILSVSTRPFWRPQSQPLHLRKKFSEPVNYKGRSGES